jgi:hypothetical protein
MIYIYRSSRNGVPSDCELNVFHGREHIEPSEVRLVDRQLYNGPYTHAEPAKPGSYAFGGSFLYTCNGVYKEFNKPIPLHDRDMSLERRNDI